MRIRISHGNTRIGGEVIDPVDPLPPVDVNTLFDLKAFDAAKTVAAPFEQVELNWAIEPIQDGLDPSDYVFSLISPNGVRHAGAEDLPLVGSYSYEVRTTALLMISVRRRDGGRLGELAPTLQVQVDESDCRIRRIPALVMDSLVAEEVQEITDSSPELRLRGGRSVEPTWNWYRVRYHLPLEIVIPNFFNADLDVDLEFLFDVSHDGDQTVLEVTVNHSSDVDFSTGEHIFSFGSAAIVEETADRLIPLIIACEARHIERDVARQVLAYIEDALAGHRLLAAREFPDDHPEGARLELILCPYPV